MNIMKKFKQYTSLLMVVLFVGFGMVFTGCGGKKQKAAVIGAPRGSESFGAVVSRRGLTADDVLAAAKTYTPDHLQDEYIAINSGGQEGNLPTYLVPSMRMVKYAPTNTRQPYDGYGYSTETYKLMKTGFIDGEKILWGDTHHPGISEKNGDYDGKWLVINDKANPRLFVVDLRDFEVKQVVKNPLFRSNHGGAFFTPNSEYVMEATQYPAPYDHKYHPLNDVNFRKYWRGGLTYWSFNDKTGRIDEKKSFTFEFPPYTQDLSDAGKNATYGWGFTNSFCTEMYIGGDMQGRPPFEAGCSSRDVDYLHITNWKKAAELVKAGKFKMVNGMKVIPIKEAIKYGLLYLIPEPKSPHGVDVDPTGDYIIVAGKLDSHAWVYSWAKIKKAIKEKNFEGHDSYGIPIIALKTALHGSVEVGLGPLHNQFDPKKGIIYTSVYVDSWTTKWNYITLKVLDHVSSNYNIGHLVSAHGDTKHPEGKYLIELDKLSIDRFNPVGPLHPQNHQLIDISGPKMKIIYDLPLPMGEPHYTVLINKNEIVKPRQIYPVGTNIVTLKKAPYATAAGKEYVKRYGNTVEVFGTIADGKVTPQNIDVNQGQNVIIHLTNTGQSELDHYVYEIASYDKQYHWRPGETATLAFKASKAGMYPLMLDDINSPEGRQLEGYLAVKYNAKADNDRVLAFSKRIQKDNEMQKFKPSAIELKNLLPGELEFLNYGCTACHKFGKDFNGPDLLMVDKRRSDAWLKSWIMHPEKHRKEADIEAMRQKYKLAMPNQNVSAQDINKIIEFLKAKSAQVMKQQQQ
jgi:nitrous-oxide reductase